MWPRITKSDQWFSQSVQIFSSGHVGVLGTEGIGHTLLHVWRRAPITAKPFKGLKYSAHHR